MDSTSATTVAGDAGDDCGPKSCPAEVPFPLTLFIGDCTMSAPRSKGGFFGSSWVGTLLRMCGIIFIVTTTLLSNGDVIELEVFKGSNHADHSICTYHAHIRSFL